MFRVHEYQHNVSLALSSVLRDIGLNERMVSRRKRTYLLKENMDTASNRLRGMDISTHYFGSQSEGTTTNGLKSDEDVLHCYHDTNVMQDWENWKAYLVNLRMIQDDTPPGYCRLQKLYSNIPLPFTEARKVNEVKIREDMVVLKNSFFDEFREQDEVKNGAAGTVHLEGFFEQDRVHAFQFEVLPHRVRTWVQSQMDNGTISREMKKYMESNPCYVVPVGSKASQHEALEWRISTSHIERCLMFNLNVTQIQCYVMMKLILKSYLGHPHTMLSSFVCKNILLLCIEKTDAREWRPSSLLNMLSFCLHYLKLCVIFKTCPHFVIRENNLLAPNISTVAVNGNSWLSERVKLVLQCIDVLPLFLNIDDIGIRLQVNLNLNTGLIYNFSSAEHISQDTSAQLAGFLAAKVSECHKRILDHCVHQTDVLHSLYQTLVKLHYRKCQFQRLACAPVKHLLYTDVGCTIASAGLQRDNSVPYEALIWFQAGLNSDVASSRLKLASMFYCSGDLNTVAYILGNVEQKYNIPSVVSKCSCYNVPSFYYSVGFREYADRHHELSLENIALCFRFPKSEIYCVPEELRYEMFRSTREELLHRNNVDDCWMDWVAVDSFPYLFFLQYQTYSRLGRHDAKERALVNLSTIVNKEHANFGHRETAWNLLGQCFEQENRLQEAFQCYRISLSIRSNNNAARIHVIRLLVRRRNQQGNL